MKKNFLSILMMLVSLVLSITFTSCSSDPETPIDETEHHDHDEPAKAILTLAQGHFHGGNAFHQEAEREGVKYLKAVQTITFALQEGKGWTPTAESAKQFVVMAGTKDSPIVYGLKIKYEDAHGHDVTGEFVENGQDKIHQHFFIPSNIQPMTNGGQAETGTIAATDLLNYTYLDTDPWDKTVGKDKAKVTGTENPVGIKGWFNFLKDHKKFDLNIRLMHAKTSKFVNGVASPFYQPTDNQIANEHWDIIMKVPVVIVHTNEQANQWQSANGTAFDLLNENEKTLVQALAEAYSISVQDMLTDWYQYRLNIQSEESGSIRF